MGELEYLRQLCQKYGSHYIRKYFGFSLKNIADKIGIPKERFSKILANKAKMNTVCQERFEVLFKEMEIEKKTKDFKETGSQLGWKKIWKSVKNA